MICTDASVAAKWFFAEEHAAQASALLRDALGAAEPLVAPPLLPSEVANVIRQRLRQGQVRLDEARGPAGPVPRPPDPPPGAGDAV